MPQDTMLLLTCEKTPDAVIKGAVDEAQAQARFLQVLVTGLPPVLPYSAYSGVPYGTFNIPDTWPDDLHRTQEALETRVNEVEKLLSQAGVSGTVEAVCASTYDLRAQIGQRAMIADYAQICDDLRDEKDLFDDILYGLLFLSATPVILNGGPLAQPQNIFVAWDTSLPAARAVRAALPLLRSAKEVVIGCFDPIMSRFAAGENPGSDIAKWLTRQGCNVTVNQYGSGGVELAEAFQTHAKELGSDLLVMGAYGHARSRQAVFGGTTRSMLEQQELQLLMAH